MRISALLLLLCFALLVPASAFADEDAAVDPLRAELSSRGNRSEQGQSGLATWYGQGFHGSQMANGVPFDMTDPTIAASNTYPLGTRLRVTRVATGESIVVTVSDRGAFGNPILVDLSYAAFSQLGNPSDGVMRITVEPVE
jgi:rare lipoprotein A